jgi:mannose-1-phosphate guanylyltransferase/phosphomannomutase
LPKGATVMTSRDSSRSARMLKRSMMAGFNAVGVNVLDLEVASIPVTRFATRQPLAAAGVTVRLDPADPQNVLIRLFDSEGADLPDETRRKVERLVDREDFRRVIPPEIGDIGFPPRVLEHYATAVTATVDVRAIRARKPKAVLDYAFGSASFVMPDVLAKLGADVLAVNPFASTAGLLEADPAEQAARVGELVRAAHADLGGLLSADGTRLVVIDDEGRVLDGDQAQLVILRLVGPHVDGSRVALPVHSTRHAARLVREAGLEVLESGIGPRALVAAAGEDGVGFAASDDGGFILPGLLPAFDAGAMFVKLLELLSVTDRSLSAVVDDLPVSHRVHRTVHTPWDQKGAVMRGLVERTERELVLVDGVKVLHGDDWALAIPDAEEPITHIWAEADELGAAQRLAEEYRRRIEQLVLEASR